MGITVVSNKEDGTVTIKVSGEFNFTLQREFRMAYENYDSKTKFKVDLGDTTHIDSAGLGILMAMRTKLGGETAKIELCKCKPNISELMDIFHFDRYFTIIR